MKYEYFMAAKTNYHSKFLLNFLIECKPNEFYNLATILDLRI